MNKVQKVAVALSGGVDSAVSAALLKKQGYNVTAVYMVCWDKTGAGCSSDKDRVDAAKVAAHLNIPILAWDFTKEYKEKVIEYFYAEYQAGRTPNPDVMCNKEIKFGLFFNKAFKELGVDYIATGHYARIGSSNVKKPIYSLLTGVDETKDQSYFLYQLDQDHLSKTLFPVGDLKKEEVRKIAKELKLPVWDKPDSQGICFVGEVNIRKFLEQRIKPQKGNVLDIKGDIIGTHEGAWFYTIGQRHGFTAQKKQSINADPEPLYVLSKNIKANTVIVGSKDQAMAHVFEVSNVHFIDNSTSLESLTSTKDIVVRIRHLGKFLPVKNVHYEQNGALKVALKENAFGVAEGQSAVFYKGEEVLGGGVIVK